MKLKTYIVDIDGTICRHKNDKAPYDEGEPIQERIEWFNKLYDQGHKIIYWTARGAFTGVDHSELTKRQLDQWGVKRSELRMDKPAYDLWIDDRAINVDSYFTNAEDSGHTTTLS